MTNTEAKMLAKQWVLGNRSRKASLTRKYDLKKASSTGADPNLLYDSEIMEFLQSNPGLLAQMRLKIAV